MADDKKTVTIVVEGTPHEWPKEKITYTEVVTLEVPDYAQHPEITYAVKYTKPALGARLKGCGDLVYRVHLRETVMPVHLLYR